MDLATLEKGLDTTIPDLKLLVNDYNKKKKEQEIRRHNVIKASMTKYVNKYLVNDSENIKRKLLEMARRGDTRVMLLTITKDYNPIISWDAPWSFDYNGLGEFRQLCKEVLEEVKKQYTTLISPDIELYLVSSDFDREQQVHAMIKV